MSIQRSSPARTRRPEYRQVADALRSRIIEGKWKPGFQLPSTPKVAEKWRTSYCTANLALQALAREGWVERVQGTGTYVADARTRFTCAGIFHSFDPALYAHSAFGRSLQAALMRLLDHRNKDVLIFTDPRPYKKQDTVLSSLADAVSHRRIQCVIAPTVNSCDIGWLTRLPVPTAFIENPFSPNVASYSHEQMMKNGLLRLAAMGCRSVGLVTTVTRDRGSTFSSAFHSGFRRLARQTGLKVRDEWVRTPAAFTRDQKGAGYTGFHALWRQPKRPDALVAYPDETAEGVIIAALETGMTAVVDQMKFLFHRNAHLPLLCPFSALWAVSDEKVLAEALLDLIERQLAGEKNKPITIPYGFQEGPLMPAVK